MSGNTDIFNKHPDELAMHPTSRQLLRTWERIRAERDAPMRSEMTIRDLAAIVPWTCVLNRDVHNMSYQFRLAGSAVCDVWGRQLTGTEAFSDWSTFDRETMVRALDTVVGMKQPCVGRFLAHSYGGREIGFEFAAVPVISANGTHIHALATFAPFKRFGVTNADPLVEFQVRRIRILWSDQIPGQPASVPASSSADVRRLNTSFLRVIDGGKSR
jgi:hypothetical protein